MRDALTDRQDQIYEAILDYWAEHALSPTFADLMAATGIGQTNAIRGHVAALRRKGWLMPAAGNKAARDLVPTDLVEPVKHAACNLKVA